ncbi:MAG: transporter substrate-binding domain-containing protein [Pseudomonadota bacterium]|nr:transporter substrate-binding domain-containing protein [Pseudomonadota bacterium]
MLRTMAVLAVLFQLAAGLASAQTLTVATVERPPFSTQDQDTQSGFSIELWRAVAKEIGQDFRVVRLNSFPEMLGMVERMEADIAVANISITAEREQVLDFSHAIFQSGLQIMVPKGAEASVIWSALVSRDLLFAAGIAFLMLFGGGMLMWRLERGAQPYFDKSASEAMFPSFWWALNLVVNGGFEERVPRTFFGRIFGVILVVSSLFIVSIFVAKITAVLTVDAIQGSVNSVNDLYGREVATIGGSTSAGFLEERQLDFREYPDLQSLLAAFEDGSAEAVVFDAPVLAYYASHDGRDKAQMVGSAFRRESYGFALPSGSPLLEPINRSLLKLREDGTYDRLYRKYFGALD